MASSIQERLKKLEYQYKCLCANPSGGVGPEGPQGPQGNQGPPGYGIDLQGELANPSLLPQPSTQGFAYLIDTDFWVYDSSGTWINAGPIQGPEGPEGPQGNQGNPGLQGDPGTQGNPGQGFTYQGNWDNNTAYYPYDVVTYLGSTYITPNSNVSSVPAYNNSNPDWYLFTSVGQQGPPGNSGSGGGSSCPNHFKLAGVSGIFQSNSSNSPFINGMFCSNSDLGWSFGQYDTVGDSDGYGNLIYVKPSHTNGGIPLTIDLNVGDTVKISGLIYLDKSPGIAKPTNVKYYVTVSTFSCSNIGINDSPTPVTTVIPVAPYSLENEEYVCFSESVILPSILPANETFFVVGLGFGTDSITSYYYTSKFSYSLDVTQACIGVGKNYLIRNCCDPAYTEIIIDNGVELGKSFVDTDGNCWTVESEVTGSVNGTRAVSTEYFNCETCISNNPCPQNLVIESCCSEIPQVFSAALPAVNVGDTFVDINGFCWSAIDSTPLPITNVIEVDIVYTATSCQDETCTNTNTCPTPIELVSCCGNLRGFTTLELLQAVLPTFEAENVFVDTFGMCWNTKDSAYAFPNLTFIVPVIDYGYNNCAPCVGVNECPTNLYYTIQNCCTEEIEVVLMDAIYDASQVLTLTLNTAFGCYEVLSWSDTGTPTATLLNVGGVHSNCETCEEYIRTQYGSYYCAGVEQCCGTFETDLGIERNGFISGYKCDGEFILDYPVSPGNTICMAFVIVKTDMGEISECCEFDVFNPSLVAPITIIYKTCNSSFEIETELPANTLLSSLTRNCVRCARTYKPGQEFEYRICN